MAFDLTCLTASQANARLRRSASVGWRCRHDLPGALIHAARIGRLRQQAARHRAQYQRRGGPPSPARGMGDHIGIAPTRHHHAAVLLVRGQPGQRIGRVARRNQHLDEQAADLLDEGQIDLAIRGDDRAVGRHRIACKRQPVRLQQRFRRGQTAGVRVLDDRHGRLGELLRHGPGRFEIDDVVVAELLALELLEGRRGAGPAVERRLLVRVLAVAQQLHALGRQSDRFR